MLSGKYRDTRMIPKCSGAGSSRIVEIDIESTAVGNCETHLMCVLENVEKPIKLFVKVRLLI